MTQTAKVKRILAGQLAEVAVKRVSACAHDCSKCVSGGCQMMEHPDLTVRAYNAPGAKEGDVVLLESSSKQILSMAVVVYLLPFVLLFIGYAIGSGLGFGEAGSFLIGAIGFCVSFAISIALNKSAQAKAVQFTIVRIIG